jgi:hypothetical protein
MVRRRLWLVLASFVITLGVAAALVPWLLYWIGLGKIDGYPRLASQTAVAAEDVQALWRKLRISQPVQIDPVSPYSYIFQGAKPGASLRIAWIIARSHNVQHLTDRRYWHLSGAALTVWLTRNWTSDELIAKAVELERPAASPAARP